MTTKPIVVVTVRGGLVQDVNANAPVTVYVEDWDCPPDLPLVMDFEADVLTLDQERRVAERRVNAQAAGLSTEPTQDMPTRFDDYEIQPCRRYIDADEPDKSFVEPCEPFEADFWTLYGHIAGQGVQAIGDFDAREHAQEVYARITGQSYQATGIRQLRVASQNKA